MLKRSLLCLAALLILPLSSAESLAEDEFNHPTADWLTWSLTNAAGDDISLTGYQNQSTYVVVFSAANEDSCTMMHNLADYIRDHPNKAGQVLAMCSDDTGAKALKLHIRQEEWKKRVAEWESAQEEARQQAQQAGEEFVPSQMPDYVKEIEDELADPDDLAALMTHHFPFNAACRCENMWDWLSERMDGSATAPRILKFNSNGVEANEWNAPFDLPQLLGG
jgi:hypothetical protein